MSTISLVQKKIIKSLLYGNYDLMGIYFSRIYTLGRDSKFWLYSGLEGALIYCIDLRPRVLRFLLFNLKTYEIVFDCELYKKFNQSFQKGTDTFFYFDVNDGYIGFEIPDLEEAASLEKEISLYSDELIKNRLKEIKNMKENELKEKGRQMIQLLATKYDNNSMKQIKPEIIINQNELENSLNTIEIDDDNEKLILTGTGYIGINKELKKIRGLSIEESKNFEENEIFSKYIARNFLTSLMRGLVVPKRKIDRDIMRDIEVKETSEDEPKEVKICINDDEDQEKEEKNEINEEPKNEIIDQEEPENKIIEQEEPENKINEKEEPENEINEQEEPENKTNEKEEPENEIIEQEEPQNEIIEQEEPENEIIEQEEPENKNIEQEEPEDKIIERDEPENNIIEKEQPENEVFEQEEQEDKVIEQEESENKNIEHEETENKIITKEAQDQEKVLNKKKEQEEEIKDSEKPKKNPVNSKGKGVSLLSNSQPQQSQPPLVSIPSKQTSSSKPFDFVAQIAEKKKKLKPVEIKNFESPILKKKQESSNQGGSGTNMIEQIRAKLTQLNKERISIMSNKPQKNPLPNENKNEKILEENKILEEKNNQVQQKPSEFKVILKKINQKAQEPKDNIQTNIIQKKNNQNNLVSDNIIQNESNNNSSEVISEKGNEITPPISTLPPSQPPVESIPPKQPSSSKPIDFAAQLAEKKKNLKHIEPKNNDSPALKKKEEVPNSGDTNNNTATMIMAKKNQLKKVGETVTSKNIINEKPNNIIQKSEINKNSIPQNIKQKSEINKSFIPENITQKPEINKSSLPQNIIQKFENNKSSIPQNITQKPEINKSSIPSNLTQKPEINKNSKPTNLTQKPENNKSSILQNIIQKFEKNKSSIPTNIAQKSENNKSTIPENITQKPEINKSSISENITQKPENNKSSITTNIIQKFENNKSSIQQNIKQKPEISKSSITTNITQKPEINKSSIPTNITQKPEINKSSIAPKKPPVYFPIKTEPIKNQINKNIPTETKNDMRKSQPIRIEETIKSINQKISTENKKTIINTNSNKSTNNTNNINPNPNPKPSIVNVGKKLPISTSFAERLAAIQAKFGAKEANKNISGNG